MFDNLVSRFASAGLDLRLASAPFAAASSEIFQLDIRRVRAHDPGSEHFLCWPGEGTGSAHVAGADRAERQVVLTVREGQRDFVEEVPRWMLKRIQHAPGSDEWRTRLASRIGVRPELLIAYANGTAAIRRSTTSATRHMLVGRDERQLFMCELPRAVTSVKAAHEALRAPQARMSKHASKSALDRPIRQGEWFFVVPSKWDLSELEKALSSSLSIIRRKTSINSVIPRMGKPHIAEELVFTKGRVFVRGSIRHPDHKTLHITQWRQVFRNNEVAQGRSPLGGTWID